LCGLEDLVNVFLVRFVLLRNSSEKRSMEAEAIGAFPHP
jgi:hypothetical protein